MTNNYDTLEKQVQSESLNEMGFRNLSSQLTIVDLATNDSIVVPYELFINKYRYFLADHILEIELDDIQYEKFRQNPHALSEILYGSIHFWHVLLELNNCISRTQFNLRKIKYYNPNTIKILINEIKLKNDEIDSININ